jgi:hypothetical protein
MGHTLQTLLSTYTHVIEELRGSPRRSAESLIREGALGGGCVSSRRVRLRQGLGAKSRHAARRRARVETFTIITEGIAEAAAELAARAMILPRREDRASCRRP